MLFVPKSDTITLPLPFRFPLISSTLNTYSPVVRGLNLKVTLPLKYISVLYPPLKYSLMGF